MRLAASGVRLPLMNSRTVGVRAAGVSFGWMSLVLFFVSAFAAPAGGDAQQTQGPDLRARAIEHYNALQAWIQRLAQKRPGPNAKPEELAAFNKEYAQYAASLAQYKKEAEAVKNAQPVNRPPAMQPDATIRQAEIGAMEKAIHEHRNDTPSVAFENPPYGKVGKLGVHILRVKGNILKSSEIAELVKLAPDSGNVLVLAPGWENEPLQGSADARDVEHGGTHVIMKEPLVIFGPSVYSDGDKFEDIVYPAGQVQCRNSSGMTGMLYLYGTSPRLVQEMRAQDPSLGHKRGSGSLAVGTGFFISAQGHLVTNWHVVSQASRLEVRMHGQSFKAKLLFSDEANDLAVLKVEVASQPLPVSSSRDIALGDDVFTIGFPNIDLQGFQPKLTTGKISSLAGIRDDPRFFQISVPVQPGNSGGCLVDAKGNVVGVVTRKLKDSTAWRMSGAIPQNVNYAVKSSLLLALLETSPEIGKQLPVVHATQSANEKEAFQAAEAATVMVMAYE